MYRTKVRFANITAIRELRAEAHSTVLIFIYKMMFLFEKSETINIFKINSKIKRFRLTEIGNAWFLPDIPQLAIRGRPRAMQMSLRIGLLRPDAYVNDHLRLGAS